LPDANRQTAARANARTPSQPRPNAVYRAVLGAGPQRSELPLAPPRFAGLGGAHQAKAAGRVAQKRGLDEVGVVLYPPNGRTARDELPCKRANRNPPNTKRLLARAPERAAAQNPKPVRFVFPVYMKKSHWSSRGRQHAKNRRPLFGPVFFTTTTLEGSWWPKHSGATVASAAAAAASAPLL
jgi:hypothetical protein